VVHVPAVTDGPVAINDQEPDAWAAACEAPMVEAIGVARAVGGFFDLGDPGPESGPRRLVWILPTTALGGSAGFVGVGAAGEGIRALAKGAARQWGTSCTTAVLAVSPTLLFDGSGPPDEGSLSPPALGGPGDVTTDVASLVDLLADPRSRFATGGTLVADGGSWMAP
jgi:NAD(P)-dependent dehydrogenase (short-subunit alcohol dehydrogenase family)